MGEASRACVANVEQLSLALDKETNERIALEVSIHQALQMIQADFEQEVARRASVRRSLSPDRRGLSPDRLKEQRQLANRANEVLQSPDHDRHPLTIMRNSLEAIPELSCVEHARDSKATVHGYTEEVRLPCHNYKRMREFFNGHCPAGPTLLAGLTKAGIDEKDLDSDEEPLVSVETRHGQVLEGSVFLDEVEACFPDGIPDDAEPGDSFPLTFIMRFPVKAARLKQLLALQ